MTTRGRSPGGVFFRSPGGVLSPVGGAVQMDIYTPCQVAVTGGVFKTYWLDNFSVLTEMSTYTLTPYLVTNEGAGAILDECFKTGSAAGLGGSGGALKGGFLDGSGFSEFKITDTWTSHPGWSAFPSDPHDPQGDAFINFTRNGSAVVDPPPVTYPFVFTSGAIPSGNVWVSGIKTKSYSAPEGVWVRDVRTSGTFLILGMLLDSAVDTNERIGDDGQLHYRLTDFQFELITEPAS